MCGMNSEFTVVVEIREGSNIERVFNEYLFLSHPTRYVPPPCIQYIIMYCRMVSR